MSLKIVNPLISYDQSINKQKTRFGSIVTVSSRQNNPVNLAFLKLHSLTRACSIIEQVVTDNIGSVSRFCVLTVLQSVTSNYKLKVVSFANETKPVVTLQNIFASANWSEREIWDMFGLFIVNHPDLRRILTDYGFVGHPLKKDFPLTGFKENQFEDSIKQVDYVKTELSQEFRLANIQSSWLADNQLSSNSANE